MISNTHEYFEEIEIEHDFRTYYANGYVEYNTKETIGTNYEGYAYEILYERELCDITISNLWYNDEDTGNSVDIMNHNNYREIEEITEEVIRYRFE